MSEDITYCANDTCEKRYKCERFRELPGAGKGDFWFAIFKPESCPERDLGNIWENKYYEQIGEAEKDFEEKLQDYKSCVKDDLAGLTTKIYNLLDKKISDEDMDQILNWINEVGADIEKRRF